MIFVGRIGPKARALIDAEKAGYASADCASHAADDCGAMAAA